MDENNLNQNPAPVAPPMVSEPPAMPSERPPMSPVEAQMFATPTPPSTTTAPPAPISPKMANEPLMPHVEIKKETISPPPISPSPSVSMGAMVQMMPQAKKSVWPKIIIAVLVVVAIFLAYEYWLYRSMVNSAIQQTTGQTPY